MSDHIPSFAARASRFQFRRRVGEGAFGVVWEVYDEKREARVALKSLVRTDAAALLRFKREFRAFADLVHPNLVTLYELLAFDDVWFFTMEFVDGVDFVRYVSDPLSAWASTEDGMPRGTERLADTGQIRPTLRSSEARSALLQSRVVPWSAAEQEWQRAPTMSWDFLPDFVNPLVDARADTADGNEAPRPISFNPERIRAATRQLTLGLSALHDARKLHSDIKPSNVLVTSEGRVVILDFGLIADLPPEGITEGSQAVVGTPGFMSPEQALGKALSPATDWYSVGAMLYVAMTGRMPFEGETLQLLLAQQQRDPVPPSEHAPGIPADLEALCLDLLRRNPEERPGMTEIVARLGGPDTLRMSIPPPTTRRAAFVGREAYLWALRESYALTERGRAAAVLVHGGSGVGKSALVRRFLGDLRARAPDAMLLSGRCYEREAVPYKAIDNLIDELSVYLRKLDPEDAAALMPRGVESLVRLFPVLRDVEALASPQQPAAPIVDPLELRRRAFGALRDLLARLAGTRPVVIAIDDLQWSDADSDALLAELVRHPAPPLLLIATYRVEELRESPLRTALGTSVNDELGMKVRELAVREFSPAEAEELAGALLGFGEVSRARAIALESRGNPLFIEALVQHLELRPELMQPSRPRDTEPAEPRAPVSLSVPTRKTGRASYAPPSLGVLNERGPRSAASALSAASERLPAPPSLPGARAFAGEPRIDLAEMLRVRVDLLPDASRRLLEGVVVAGRPVDLTLATRVAGISSFEPSMLTMLVVSHLLKSQPRGDGAIELEAYHDRVREHVLGQIPPAQRQAYHAALAGVLEATGHTDPEFLAAQYQAAGRPEKAIDYALRAAAEAFDALAFDRAARLYEGALGQMPSPSRALLLRFGEALANAGRGAKAADAFLAAGRGVSGSELLDLRRRAAEQLLISGHVERGLELFRKVLDSLGMSMPTSSRGAFLSLLFRRAHIAVRGLRFQERDATSVELMRVDACWAVAVGLALVDAIRGAEFQARHLLLALDAGEPYRICRALALEVPFSATGGTRTRARTEQILAIGSALAERSGDAHALGLTTMARGTAHFLVGEWEKAFELSAQAELLFRERCVGVSWEIDTAEIFALNALMMLGRWRELTERVEGDLRTAAARGDLYATTHINIVVGWCVEVAADRPLVARQRLDDNFRQESRKAFGTEHVNHLYASANIHLYLGEAEAAHRLLEARWGDLRRSFTFEIQSSLLDMFDLRARAAIGWALHPGTSPSRRKALLAAAERDLERIEKEGVPWGNAVARLGRATLSWAAGAPTDARLHAIGAESALRACGMEVHAAVARRKLGELSPGAEGRALIDSADLRLAAHGVKAPERVAAMYAPGRF